MYNIMLEVLFNKYFALLLLFALIFLDNLVLIKSIWPFQLNLLSINAPRNLVVYTGSILAFLMLISIFIFFAIAKQHKLVLDTLRDNLLVANHIFNLSNSLFMILLS